MINTIHIIAIASLLVLFVISAHASPPNTEQASAQPVVHATAK
ncbi:hypothetical protein [Sulfuriflexus mobilis]|nr:hypothetical protein [Sulfuriflexus mobilis]